jgi:hypothetical protein
LSLIFPDAPALPALLTPDIRIELIGRLRLSRIGSTEVATRERVIGTADIQSISEPTEGIAYLRGTIQAGKAGRGSSWKVFGMADIQFVIRTIIQPPKTISCHLPSWRNEIEVQLVTDLWGTSERELIATGGIPTPALALANAGPRVTSYSL